MEYLEFLVHVALYLHITQTPDPLTDLEQTTFLILKKHTRSMVNVLSAHNIFSHWAQTSFQRVVLIYIWLSCQ